MDWQDLLALVVFVLGASPFVVLLRVMGKSEQEMRLFKHAAKLLNELQESIRTEEETYHDMTLDGAMPADPPRPKTRPILLRGKLAEAAELFGLLRSAKPLRHATSGAGLFYALPIEYEVFNALRFGLKRVVEIRRPGPAALCVLARSLLADPVARVFLLDDPEEYIRAYCDCTT